MQMHIEDKLANFQATITPYLRISHIQFHSSSIPYTCAKTTNFSYKMFIKLIYIFVYRFPFKTNILPGDLVLFCNENQADVNESFSVRYKFRVLRVVFFCYFELFVNFHLYNHLHELHKRFGLP